MPANVGWKSKAEPSRHATGSSISTASPQAAFDEWSQPLPLNAVECDISFPSPTPPGGSTSAKRFMDIKGHQVSHDIKARSCQFMGHRFTSDHQGTLGRLTLVKPLHFWTASDGKLRCLHVCPLKIRMAIFGVPLAFPLAVADFGTPDTAAIRRIVAHR